MSIKRFGILCLASVSLLAMSSLSMKAAHAETTSGTPVLSMGSSSSLVTSVQSQLKQLGYFSYPSITGYYGTVTAQAVKDFQSDYGLQVDGLAGPITQTSLSHALVKQAIVADSYKYVGIPYAWGGSSPETGFDCSGYVSYLFNSHGVSMQRTTSDNMYKWGTPVATSKLMPGDLVFFSLNQNGQVSHVGVYLGNDQFMSALSSKGIYAQTLHNSYWAPKYIGAKRVY